MKNFKKVAPGLLLASTLILTGCPKKVSYRNALAQFVGELPEGELTDKNAVNGIFNPSVITSADSEATYSQYTERTFQGAYGYSASVSNEALASDDPQSGYDIKDLTRTISYAAYDNDVYVARNKYIRYNFDSNFRVEGNIPGYGELILDECLSPIATRYEEESLIWKEEDNYNYVHTRDHDKDNVFSFRASTEDRDGLKNELKGAPALSSLIAEYKSSVDSLFSQYQSSSSYTFGEQFTGKKEGKNLHIQWVGVATFGLYACNRVWEDDEGMKGYYMERGKSLIYELDVVDGFPTRAYLVYDAVYRIYKEDSQHRIPTDDDMERAEDGSLEQTVKPEFAATLDLSIPEKIKSDTGTFDNTYTSWTTFEGGKADAYDLIIQKNQSLGNYERELPSMTGYRRYDRTDMGSEYFTIKKFMDF